MREQQFIESESDTMCVVGGSILPFFSLLKTTFVWVHAVKEIVGSTELRALLLGLHTTAG